MPSSACRRGSTSKRSCFAKEGAGARLERELAAPGYKPKTIALGTSTDPYQPIERERRITRSILEVLERANHPVGIVTKSALVARDIDLLAPMAAKGLVKVAVSVTTLDPALARTSRAARAHTPQAARCDPGSRGSRDPRDGARGAAHPGRERPRGRGDSRRRPRGGRGRGRLCGAAPAARGARPLPGMAARAFPPTNCVT